jgi:hypothetical protein
MKLSDFAGPLVAENKFIKASFGGFAGAGKTRTASEFIAGVYKDFGCDKPLLMIDNERGSRYLVKFFQDQGIETIVKNTVHLADVLTAFAFLERGDVSFVFADSLTKVWYQYIRDYRANHNNRRMTLNDWGVVIPEWQEKFSDKLIDVKGNIVFTGRGGFEYDLEEVEEGSKTKKQFVRSGVKMKLQGETAFETDLNVWMETKEEVENGKVVRQWREALVMKDRSATVDGKVFIDPCYANFKPIIDYLNWVPKGEVKGASDTTNMAPSEVIQTRGKERNEQLEIIYASFEQLGLSAQSTEGKKLKLDLWETLFGTNSKSKVEGYSLEILKACAEAMVEYKNRISILAEEGTSMTPAVFKSTLDELKVEFGIELGTPKVNA